MQENLVSKRVKNQNSLNTKMKTFRDNFDESFRRMNSKSSLHNLAGTIYSSKVNQDFSPKKTKRPVSGSHLPQIYQNPEIQHSGSALKGLNMRASHIPNYSDLNTQLLLQKRNQQERIKFLKEEIAKQTRQKNKSEYNCKKYSNQIEHAAGAYNELCCKSDRLFANINQTRQDCQHLRMNVHQLNQKNADKVALIKKEEQNIEELENKTRVLKLQLLQDDKLRNYVKSELIKQQKVMNSESIEAKELEEERAMVLLEINKSVAENRR